jgi:hypothetical protein
VILRLALVDGRALFRRRLREQPGEIEAFGLPMLHQFPAIEHLHLPDHFIESAESERGHQLPHFFGNKEKVIDDVLGLAFEALAQHRILSGDAHRASIEVALAHHDAAGRDQRRGREAKLVCAQQRANRHVPAGADTAVHLNRDAATQAVDDQRLMRLGEADFPRAARMLDRGQRACARATLEASDRDVIGARL